MTEGAIVVVVDECGFMRRDVHGASDILHRFGLDDFVDFWVFEEDSVKVQ